MDWGKCWRKGDLSVTAKHWEIFSSFRSMRRTMPHHVCYHFGDRFLQFTFSSYNYFLFKPPRDPSIYATSLSTWHSIGKGLRVHWHQIPWKALIAWVALCLFEQMHIWVIVWWPMRWVTVPLRKKVTQHCWKLYSTLRFRLWENFSVNKVHFLSMSISLLFNVFCLKKSLTPCLFAQPGILIFILSFKSSCQ